MASELPPQSPSLNRIVQMTDDVEEDLTVCLCETGDVDITEVSCADLFHICLRQMPPFVQSGYLRTAIFGCVSANQDDCDSLHRTV